MELDKLGFDSEEASLGVNGAPRVCGLGFRVWGLGVGGWVWGSVPSESGAWNLSHNEKYELACVRTAARPTTFYYNCSTPLVWRGFSGIGA